MSRLVILIVQHVREILCCFEYKQTTVQKNKKLCIEKSKFSIVFYKLQKSKASLGDILLRNNVKTPGVLAA